MTCNACNLLCEGLRLCAQRRNVCAQALNIPTKINKGCVEIVSDVHLIKTSEKVGGSEATLLAKLGIKPFSYGLVIQKVLPLRDMAFDCRAMSTLSSAATTVSSCK